MDSKIYMDLSVSRNGQLGCPFHEMDNLLVHFAKWTISHLDHNIYIRYLSNIYKMGKNQYTAMHVLQIILGMNDVTSLPWIALGNVNMWPLQGQFVIGQHNAMITQHAD